jgi:hypothetical protein
MLNEKEKVMRKYVVGLCVLVASGICVAQVVTYLDAKGRPFVYATPVGNGNTTYTNRVGQPVGYASPSVPAQIVNPISTPQFVFPLVEPTLPALPTLPTVGEIK